MATLGVDASGVIVAANAAALLLLGCGGDALLGAPVESLVPADERARHVDLRAASPTGGAPRPMTSAPEVPLARPGGGLVFVRVGLGSVTLREGRFTVATLTDQTSRHELNRRTQQVFETSPAAICVWQQRLDGSVCMPFASPSVERLYGATREELARSAEVILRRVHPDDLPRVMESIAASARDMTPWRCTYRVTLADQPTRWLEGHSMPTREADGSISWVGTVLDVSERHRAEALIAETRAQLDNALEAARAYTFMVDFRSGAVHFDDRAARLFGAPPEALLGYTVTDLGMRSHPDDRPMIREALARVLEGDETDVALVHRLLRGDGEYVTFSLRGARGARRGGQGPAALRGGRRRDPGAAGGARAAAERGALSTAC